MDVSRQEKVVGLSMARRLQVVALVFAGQIVGLLCAALVLSILGIASHSLPVLGSRSVATVMFPLLFIGAPILASWAFLKRLSGRIRPFLVSVFSYLCAGSLFVWILWLTGGVRQAVGAALLPLIGLLPIASAFGSYLGSHLRVKVKDVVG